MNQFSRNFLLWSVIAVAMISLFSVFNENDDALHGSIPYSTFVAQVESGQVQEVSIQDRVVTVQPKTVVLSREGKTNTTMEFQEGKKSYFLYETPFGSATMGLDTRRIRSSFDFHGGDMEIEYTVDMDQTIVGRNRFYIQVKEPKTSHTGDIRWPI